MQTIRLFKEDVYKKEASAKVTSVAERDGKTIVTLDHTIFFPTGGGQTCDLGTIAGIPVVDVYEYEDEIYHQLEDGDGTAATRPALAAGDEVNLELDWTHRFDNMQRHCGEHILTGIFYREWGGTNRGFHMGDDYMTIDIALEEAARVDSLTWEMCLEAERLTNEVITANLPMITRHFDTFEEAAKEPMRKKLTVEHDITLVGIGKPEYDWGCVACCGTHPSTTGQVGLVKIFKLEHNKGMYRIYFEAGRRAFEKYQQQFEALNTLCGKLSAGTDDVLDKFLSLQEKNKEVRNQLHFLKKDVLAKEAESILAELSASAGASASGGGAACSGSAAAGGGAHAAGDADSASGFPAAGGARADFASTGPTLPVRKYSLLTLDDLVSLSREIGPSVRKIYFLVHEPSHTVLLVSDGKKTDCVKLVKENASIYNGKGGGNQTMARAIFTKDEYVDTFIDLIEKHLR